MNIKRTLVVVVLLAAVALTLGFFWPFGKAPPNLRLPGVVEIQEVRLGSKIGGRVAEVRTAEGEVVEAGQVLVRFEVPELKAQYEQLEAREKLAEAELDKAENGPRTQEIEEAEAAVRAAAAKVEMIDAGPRPQEIRHAQAEWDTANADLKWSTDELERIDRTFRQGAGTRSEYDNARAAQDRARGRTAAAQAKLDLMLAGNRKEEKAQARAESEQSQAKLRLWQAGTRAEDKRAAAARLAETRAKLREMKATLEEADVRAPEKSVVQVLAVRKGDLVPPNQPVLRVLRTDDLWVKVYVPETELGKVKVGQKADITVDAYPDKHLQGSVMSIASESEFTPRNVQSADERRHQVFAIKIRVDNPQGIFKSGMAAEVVLSGE